jgi:ankyrin repeat protein
MSTLPSHPNLEQLRHQARDLLRAARAGEPEASARVRAVSERVTLSAAQLAIAREYGFASWPALKAELEARTSALADAVEAFLRFSVGWQIGRARRVLAQHPAISGYDVRTAIALGDAERVARELERDPDLVTRRDPATGWTALHLACASRWHVESARTGGLLTIVRLLLDAGADLHRQPNAESPWSPLRCAVASAGSGRGNEPIVRLLLERGAEVADDDLYLAGFAVGGDQWCLRLLLAHTRDVRAIAAHAFASAISSQDVEAVRALLEAGADPRRYRDDDNQPAAAVPEAIDHRCAVEVIELLLAHGADPNQTGKDGRSAYASAVARGRADLVELLERYGARDDTTPLDRLRYACLRGDRPGARQLLAEQPGLRSELASADGSALIGAAEAGDTDAVGLLLEVGFPIAARGGADGATALHAAAYAGSAATVEQLLAAGAPLEARDSTWNSTPIGWALVGSGERPALNPAPDWLMTVRILLDDGAATDEITLDPEDPKPPSPEVADLLRSRGLAAPVSAGP